MVFSGDGSELNSFDPSVLVKASEVTLAVEDDDALAGVATFSDLVAATYTLKAEAERDISISGPTVAAAAFHAIARSTLRG